MKVDTVVAAPPWRVKKWPIRSIDAQSKEADIVIDLRFLAGQ